MYELMFPFFTIQQSFCYGSQQKATVDVSFTLRKTTLTV